MANFRGRTTRRQAPEWLGFEAIARVGVTTTQSVLSFFSFAAANTLLRMRGDLLVTAVPNAVNDDDTLGLGAIIVSDEARAAGGVSIPGPISSGNASWIWHRYVGLHSATNSAASSMALGLWARVEIDSKAMRKMKPNDSLVLVAETSTGEMASVFVVGGWRTLHLGN